MSILVGMKSELPIELDELLVIIATASRRYKIYEIPKRSNRGMRIIAQPSPEVKLLQKWVVARIIKKFPVHKSARAYIKNKNIVEHAEPHANKRFLLKMDFENFFNSIKSHDVKRFLVEKGGLSEEDSTIATSILVWKNKKTGDRCVSVGAPSSPSLTNAMLYEFDRAVASFCKENSIVYTRYADDLAFSTNKKNTLEEVPGFICRFIQEKPYQYLKVNNTKTVSTSKRYQRVLAGLVLTPDGKVSLGRERKRRLRAQLNSFKYNEIPLDEVYNLRGMLAYAWSIEPFFVKSMIARYGSDLFFRLGLAALIR